MEGETHARARARAHTARRHISLFSIEGNDALDVSLALLPMIPASQPASELKIERVIAVDGAISLRIIQYSPGV